MRSEFNPMIEDELAESIEDLPAEFLAQAEFEA
jgi:hypothetical protein